MNDRIVHAHVGELEIVRYDRAGKWWAEYNPPRMRPARRLTLFEAAALAMDGVVFFSRPGGRAFDRKVRELRGEDA